MPQPNLQQLSRNAAATEDRCPPAPWLTIWLRHPSGRPRQFLDNVLVRGAQRLAGPAPPDARGGYAQDPQDRFLPVGAPEQLQGKNFRGRATPSHGLVLKCASL